MAEDSAPHIDTVADYLEAGIAAAQAGQRPLARSLLIKVIELDERSTAAWQWLSQVAEGPEEEEVCLENVLTLEPANAAAQERLARLRAGPAPQPTAPAPAELPAAPPAPPSAAAAELPMPPLINLEDRYLCPYCATRTAFADRTCRTCGGKLWQRSRQQEERVAARIGFVLGLQAIAAGLNALAIVLLLLYVSLQVGYTGIVPMLRLYLGLPGAPSAATGAALALLPRLPLLTLLALLLLAVVVWTGIYLRWRPTLYLYLVSGGGLVVVGLLTTLMLWPAVNLGDPILDSAARVAMIVLDLAILGTVFWLAMEMREDFFFDQERIVYRLAPSAVEGVDFMGYGQRYAQHGMWALAAIHYRRAIDALTDDFEAQLKLAATYGHMHRYGAAQRYLEAAAQGRPDDPRVPELRAWLERRMVGRTAG